MNPLQKHAHLFANGKFDIKQSDKHGNCTIYEWVDWTVDGGEVCTLGRDVVGEIKSVTYPMIEQCTLIARPIEDITDEEWEYLFCQFHDAEWIEQKKLNGIQHEAFLHLLSIGVYPFNQSHFEDGTVINTNEL